MAEKLFPNLPEELTESDLLRVSAGSDVADDTQKAILECYENAVKNGWKRSEFEEAAQEIMSNAKGLSQVEIGTLNSLITILIAHLPA